MWRSEALSYQQIPDLKLVDPHLNHVNGRMTNEKMSWATGGKESGSPSCEFERQTKAATDRAVVNTRKLHELHEALHHDMPSCRLFLLSLLIISHLQPQGWKLMSVSVQGVLHGSTLNPWKPGPCSSLFQKFCRYSTST